jgi:hypothetical protein
VRIPGIYPVPARPSHFRPVRDIARIAMMVAGRLLLRAMYPGGLWRSLTPPVAIESMPELTGSSGVAVADAVDEKAVLPPHSAGN